MLELEAKEVGTESESVFVSIVELGVGKGGVDVDEEEAEGGRKDILDFDIEDEVGEGVKTGGQGGNVGEEKLNDEELAEEEPDDDDVVKGMLTELDELALGGAVGMLKLKLEGKSKVMDDGMSGTDVEYDG